MIRSTSVMRNIDEVCTSLRRQMIGEFASKADFRDSYLINLAIERYKGELSELMSPKISALDGRETKISKSVNYRSSCWEKLRVIADGLKIPDSEACRRILLYHILNHENEGEDTASINVAALKEQARLLKKQMEEATIMINNLIIAIDALER